MGRQLYYERKVRLACRETAAGGEFGFANPVLREDKTTLSQSYSIPMKPFHSLASFVSAGLFALSALAATALAQQSATVVKISGKGTSTYSVNNGPATPISLRTQIPTGAVIETGPGTEIYLETLQGAISTVKENTKVELRKLVAETQDAELFLSQGNVVSTIDPNKHYKDGGYRVSTPKGVAAARGSTFTVTWDGVDYTVCNEAGKVTISPVGGGTSITLQNGQVAISSFKAGAAAVVSSLPPAQQRIVEQAATIAVAAAAVVAENHADFHVDSPELSEVVRTVVQSVPAATQAAVQTAAAAAPSQAAAVVSAAVTAAATSGQDVVQVAQVVAQAAAQGAASTTTTPDAAANVAQSVAQAAAKAAASAAPAQAANVAQVVSQAAAQGAVQGAISAGQSADNVGTAVAAGAAQGASQGASSVAPAQASAIAASSAQGATQGSTNAGAGNVDTTMVTNSSAVGASAGSGTTIIPPAPPTTPQAETTQTPSTQLDPTINVSPAGGV
jgi:hypothetical protein